MSWKRTTSDVRVLRRPGGTALAASVTLAGLVGATITASQAGATPVSQLMRYPYLTDLTTTSVQVTFDTSTKITSATGAVRWGTPSGTNGCTPTGSSGTKSTNTINAPITVAGAVEYQSSITFSGLSAGTRYCYRIYSGGSSPVDLLGSDPSPSFVTLPSSSSPLTFDVFGDWGDTSVAGGASQARIDSLIASSGASFALSTGDIAYPDGTQNNYGNLKATGTAVSQVFGPSFWAAPGASTPLFSTTGNHGRSTTFLQNWKQPATVAASGGKYAMETYSGQDGTTAASYPSTWYAFSVGSARFYVLSADWADTNFGTASGAYQVDRDYHWQPSSPEYQWLRADLASHPGGLKFAAFHFPLRSNDATEPSDTYLQGSPNDPSSTGTLEGLLYNNGVNLAFNGHAHTYQRNLAPPGAVTSYVTGGGGAKLVPVNKSRCSSTDAYALGWSYSGGVGSNCGAAPTPTSDATVYHFLKVTISGTSVTVTPTNSNGATFDPVTYNFGADSTAPAAPTALLATAAGTGVKLSWTASSSSDASAQDVYRNGSFLATVAPSATSYTDAAPVAGASYTIRAHDLKGNQSPDSAPASVGSGSDTSAPTAPSSMTATATSATSVKLGWTASTDNVGVTGYRVYRGGALLTTVAGSVLSYTDNTAKAVTTYNYGVQAIDAAGNASPITAAPAVTTPAGTGGGGSLTFSATDDATLDSTAPTANAGTSSRLAVDNSPVKDFVVKFTVAGTSGCTISNATLRLTVGTTTDNNSVKGGDFYGTDSTPWTEGSVNWSNAPAAGPTALGTVGAVGLGDAVAVNVTSAVTGDGTVSFRVKTTSSDAAGYVSRQGTASQAPQLSVSCG